MKGLSFSIAIGSLTAALLIAAAPAQASGFDACVANLNDQLCVNLLEDFITTCDNLNLDPEVCFLDVCDVAFQPSFCVNLRNIVHGLCRTGDVLTDSTCNRFSSVF